MPLNSFKIAMIQPRFQKMPGVSDHNLQTSQELRMLSRSISDCKSLTLNVMIQVWQFVSNNQLCH